MVPLMHPCGWAEPDGRYKKRFMGFWNVLVTILPFSIERVRSKKSTEVEGRWSSLVIVVGMGTTTVLGKTVSKGEPF